MHFELIYGYLLLFVSCPIYPIKSKEFGEMEMCLIHSVFYRMNAQPRAEPP